MVWCLMKHSGNFTICWYLSWEYEAILSVNPYF
jgi:hypothetical protein